MWQKMQKMAKNDQNAIFWHFFANILAYSHNTAMFLTVLESAYPAGCFDTNNAYKSWKKYFFVRRVPPLDFLAKKSVAPPKNGPTEISKRVLESLDHLATENRWYKILWNKN